MAPKMTPFPFVNKMTKPRWHNLTIITTITIGILFQQIQQIKAQDTQVSPSLLNYNENENSVYHNEENDDISSSSTSNIEMPEVFSCPTEGLYAHNYECQLYYRCETQTNGNIKAYLLSCKKGTIFSRDLKLCMPPMLANREECQQYINEIDTMTSGDGGDGDGAGYYGGDVINSAIDDSIDSRLMHVLAAANIKGGIANNGNAMEGAYNQWHNYGLTGLSGVSVISFSTSSARSASIGGSSTDNDQGPPCKDDGFMSDADDCTVFYRCISNGRTFNKIGFRCSDGTAWDESLQSCNHLFNVRANGGCQGNQGIQMDEYTNQQTATQSSQTSYQNSTSSSLHQQSSTSSSSQTSSSTSSSSSSSNSSSSSQQSSSHSSSTEGSSNSATTQNSNNESSSNNNSNSQNSESNNQNSNSQNSNNNSQNSNNQGSSNSNSQNSSGSNSQNSNSNSNQNNNSNSQNSAINSHNSNSENSNNNSQNSNNQGSSNSNSQNSAGSNSQNSNSNSNQSNNSNSQNSASNSLNSNSENSNNQGSSNSNSQNSNNNQSSSSSSSQNTNSNSNQNNNSNSQNSGSNNQNSNSENSNNEGSSNSSSHNSNNNQSSSGSNSQNSSNQASSSNSQNNNNSQSSNNEESSSNSNQDSNSTYTADKPSPTECEDENTYIQDKEDCAKFYRCRADGNGNLETVSFTCGPGTVWNQKDKVCDLPTETQREKCKITSSSSTGGQQGSSNNQSASSNNQSGSSNQSESSNSNNQSSSSNNQSNQSSSNETSSSHNQSNASNNQSSSSSNQSQSSTNQSTSSNNQQSSSNNQSGSSNNEEQQTAKPTKPSNPDGKCKDSETYLPDKSDCTRFYRCVDNGNGRFETIAFDCAPATVWDPNSKGCNHPTDVQKEQCRVMASSGGGSSGSSSSSSSESSSHNQESSSNNQGSQSSSTTNESNQSSSSSTQTSSENQSSSGSQQSQGSSTTAENNQSSGNQQSESSSGSNQSSSGLQTGSQQTTNNQNQGSNNNQSSGSSSSSNNNQSESSTSTSESNSSSQSSTSSSSNQESSSSSSNQGSSSSQSSNTNQTTTTQKPFKPATHCESEETFLEDKEDCSKFYRCTDNGKGGFSKVSFECPPNTVWHPQANSCDHPAKVHNKNCKKPASNNQGSSSSSTSTESSGSSSSTSSNNQSSGSSSTSGTTSGQQSGSSTSQESSTSQSSTQESSSSSSQSGSSSQGSSSSQESSNSQSSSHGSSSTQSQQSGSSSSSSQQSGSPSEQSGSQGSTSTSIHQNPVGNCNSNNQYLEDSKDCAKFYRCVKNSKGSYDKVAFTCGPGTVWDPQIEGCNHAWAVKDKNCGTGSQSATQPSKPATTTQEPIEQKPTQSIATSKPSTIRPSTTKPISTQKPAAGEATTPPHVSDGICRTEGFIGDPNDCSRFYRCVSNGRGGFTQYSFRCGDGTVWDSDLHTCNHDLNKCNPNVGGQGQPGYQPSTQKPQETTIKPGYQPTTQKPQETTSKPEHQPTTQRPQDITTSELPSTTTKPGYPPTSQKPQEITTTMPGYQPITQSPQDQTTTKPGYQPTPEYPQTTPTGKYPDAPTTTQPTTSTMKPEPNEPISSYDKCVKEGFFGDSNDCQKFYRCTDNGKGGFDKHSFKCGNNTVWDADIESCNHPSDIADLRCRVESTTQGPQDQTTTKPGYQPTSEYPSTTTKPGYQTTSQKPQEITTTKPGYQPITQSPQDQTTTKPGYQPTSEYPSTTTKPGYQPTTQKPQEITTTKPGYQPITQRPQDTTTTKPGYQPTSEYPQTTPTGKYPNAPTAAQPTTTTMKPEPNEPISSYDKCVKEGFFGDSNDCQNFYRCTDNGKGGFDKYSFKCGNNTVWDADIESCNHPSDIADSRCRIESTTQGPQDQTTTKPGYQPTSEYPSTTTKPGYQTTSQKPQEITTTKPGYQPITQSPQDQTTTKPGYQPTSEYPSTTTKPGYQPTSQKPQEITTTKPDYQPITQRPQDTTTTKPGYQPTSEYPQTTPTGKYPDAPTSAQPTTTTMKPEPNEPISSYDKCVKEGFFGDSNDCQKFYRCTDNGKGGFDKYSFKCGNNTVWDADIESCNHPSDIADPKCRVESTTTNKYETTTMQWTTYKPTMTTSQSTTGGEFTTTVPTTSTTAIPNLPAGTKCQGEGFMANPDNCRKFYRCTQSGDGYEKHEFKCSRGTGWSTEKQTCDHRDNIDRCQGQTEEPDPETTTMEYESTTTEKYSSTTLATTTAAFEKPTSTTTVAYEKPITTTTTYKPTTSYPTSTMLPEYTTPSSTTADYSTTMQPTSTTPVPNLPPGNKCKGEGFMADPDICRKFYRCEKSDNGYSKHEFMCAKGTGWSEEKQTCDHRDNIDRCQGQTEQPEPESTTMEYTTTSKPTSTSSSQTTTAGYDKPTTITTSTTETSTTTTDYTTTMPPTSTTPVPNLPAGTKCVGEGFMADPNNCRKFYRCTMNGGKLEKHEFMCGKGTGWSENKQTCDHASNIERCEGQTEEPETTTVSGYETTAKPTGTTSSKPIETTTAIVTKPTTTQPTTVAEITTTIKPTDKPGYVPTTTEVSTTSETSTLPPTTIQSSDKPGYVPTTEEGTAPESSTMTTTTEQYENTTMEPINHNCTGEGFFPDTEDCNRYYRCVDSEKSGNYEVYSFRCPKGTVWDTSLETCNYADKVYGNCSSGSTSTEYPPASEISTTGRPETNTTDKPKDTTTTDKPEPTTTESSKETVITGKPESTTTEETTTMAKPDTTTEVPKETTTTKPMETTAIQETSTMETTTTTTDATITQKPITVQTTIKPESPGNMTAPCPQTGQGQNLFICPTGFKRHPKNCNMFYQCTEKADSYDQNIVVFECPKGTVYHENLNRCDSPKSNDNCDLTARTQNGFEDEYKHNHMIQIRSTTPLCPNEGHFALNDDECGQLFVKCQYSMQTERLEGQIFRCPKGFTYWSVSRRCERAQKLQNCATTRYDVSPSIPVEWSNIGNRRRNLKI